ncbi:uncharacterized protein LOC134770443 [Penaeus indicus]|uniref:uncharacterized protein LOC134770443 n=1 Tax=Penaeus indicus TaxID=29960 RepID=UPI00300C9EB2
MAGHWGEIMALVFLLCCSVTDAYPGPSPLPGPWPNPFPLPDPVAFPNPLPGPLPLPNPYPGSLPNPTPLPGPVAFPNSHPGALPLPGPLPGPVAFPNLHPGPFPLSNPLPGPEPYPGPVPIPDFRPYTPDQFQNSGPYFPDTKSYVPDPDNRPYFPDSFPDTIPYSPNPDTRAYPQDDLDSRPYPQNDLNSLPYPQNDLHMRPYPQNDLNSLPYPQNDLHMRPYPQNDLNSLPYPQNDLHMRPYPQNDLKFGAYPQNVLDPLPYEDPTPPPSPLNDLTNLHPKFRSFSPSNTAKELQHSSYSFAPEVLLHSNHLPASSPLDFGPRNGRPFEGEVFPIDNEGKGGDLQPRPNRVFSQNAYIKPVQKRTDWYFLGLPPTVPRHTPFLQFVYDLQSPAEFGYPETRFADVDEMWYQPDEFSPNTLRKQRLGW